MSNINPLFILLVGATILSLVLVTEYSIFAQEEDEEKDDKDEKDKEDEEKDKEESKDKDEDEKDKEEESKDEDAENNNDTATQIIQDQLTPPINNDTTDTIVNTTTTFQEPESIAMTPTPTPTPAEEEGEFNATCQCKTTSSKKPKPPSNDPITSEQTIIPITSANIKDSKSFGQVTDPAYTSFYTVPNLLDTIIDDISFWSQAGQSSFYIHLDDTLDNYQVCSAELNVHNPKSTPYLLDVGVSKNYTGVIDQTKEKIQFEKCVKNMDEIYMTFDNVAGNYISISEIKLFGSKLTGAATQTTTIPPTLQPPLIPNEEEETENATKINIENSTAEVDIKNSTITFKFDPLTATFVGSK
ncbi:MAG TPA: hypothetical protein VFG90_08290 [Nitrososphaeraceae archaeon]|nr:hypothetical protein [Nitrososphaeraceae archaeon]